MDRVLRRHRRRLAQIVVDQWLYKARLRLLVLRLQKIFQKHWKILCFRALREVAVANMIKHKRKEVGMEFYSRSRKRHCFHAWITHCKLEISRREAMVELAQLGRRKRCREVFLLWHWHAQRHIQLQRQLLIAEQFWSLSLLSMCFMSWQLGAQRLQRKKRSKRLALGFWAHKRLTLSLRAFKKAVDLRYIISILIKKRNQRLLASLFKRWHCITIEDLNDLQEQARCVCTKSSLLKSFRTLRDYTSKKNSYRRLNRIALCFHHDQCMHCTYKAWHEYVAIRHYKRRLADAAVAHLKRKRMRSVFIRWHSYTQFKKRQDSSAELYEKKLCSKCLQIWKDLVRSKTQVCNCKDISENQALCRLSLVVTLLQYQNRLLRQGFLVMDRRSKRFSQRRQIKTLIASRACCIFRRCIRELKCAVQRHFEKSKERRCHVCTEQVSCNSENIAGGRLLVGQDSTCDTATRPKDGICKREGGSGLLSLTDPIMTSLENEESFLLKAISTVPDSAFVQRTPSEKLLKMQETRFFFGSSRGRFSRKVRLPPRRPSYLSNPFALEKHLSDPKLMREELIWTEDLLCSFDKLKEDILQKEAELSVLRERHNSVPGDKYHTEKMKFLEEKVMVLHERQSILRPIVESLVSRAGALQRSFCKGQFLHLD